MRVEYNSARGFGIVEIIAALAVTILIVAGGWHVWEANHHPGTTAPNSSTGSTQNDRGDIFRINELGVEFTVQNNITPLYRVEDDQLNGVDYKFIRFSTQQLVDKATSSGVSGCSFAITAGKTTGFSLMHVNVFSSQADAMKVEDVTSAEIASDKGYVAVGDTLFHVPLNIQRGQGICLDDATFENQQRTSLQNSLLTLRAS